MYNYFGWLVFVWLCVQLGKEWGLPTKLGQGIQSGLLILMMLVLVGVFK